MILPVFFLFLVNTILGNLWMLVISCIAYTAGIGLVTLSTPPLLADVTGMCRSYDPKCIGHTHKLLFYIGMALIAVGVAGNLVSVKPFLDEQKESNEHNNNGGGAKELFKLPVFILMVIIPIVGSIALPYVKPWSLRFGIPAIFTVLATFLFLSGVFSCGPWRYKRAKPQGSPMTMVCRVFVAAASKMFQPFPLDDQQFYRENHESFTPTRILRCLYVLILFILVHELSRNFLEFLQVLRLLLIFRCLVKAAISSPAFNRILASFKVNIHVGSPYSPILGEGCHYKAKYNTSTRCKEELDSLLCIRSRRY